MFDWFGGSAAVVPRPGPEQASRVKQLRAMLTTNAAMVQHLEKAERDVDDEHFLRRWLGASGWNVDTALQKVTRHAEWVSENSRALPVTKIDPDRHLVEELKQQKLFLQGLDLHNRPVLLFKLARNRPAEVPLDERKLGLLWCMEHTCKIADARADGRVSIIFDMRGYGFENVDSESASNLVDILQRQYPERLAKLFIYEAPTAFWVLWNMIWPFLDASTREKVSTVHGEEGLAEMHAYLGSAVLPVDLKGGAALKPFREAIAALPDPAASEG